MHFFVQDPGVSGARIEEGPNFLRWLVSHINVGYIGKVHMIIKMKSEPATALLRILIKFALVHILLIAALWLRLLFATIIRHLRRHCRILFLFFLFLLLNCIPHIFWEEEVV